LLFAPLDDRRRFDGKSRLEKSSARSAALPTRSRSLPASAVRRGSVWGRSGPGDVMASGRAIPGAIITIDAHKAHPRFDELTHGDVAGLQKAFNRS
jgi:hypothetical protein